MKRFVLIMFMGVAACSQGAGRSGTGLRPDVVGYPQTAFTIQDDSQLIGGPLAIGRVGDVLLENDQIRVIIQKPGKNAGLGSFGGTIIDADLKRASGGHDEFGEIFPLINLEWTVNYHNLEVIRDGSDGGAKIVRARGLIDVYDYLDIDFIADAAEGLVGQHLSYSNRFDDRRDPFDIYDDLRGLNPEVVTDYILEPGSRAVKMETTFRNVGDQEVRFPTGMFVNGSGELSLLIPGLGFSPELASQVANPISALVYAGYDGVPVSYGFFYDPREFPDVETGELYDTTSLTYSGLTGILFGETFLKLLQLGSNTPPEIHFSVPPQGERKITTYFVVGDGSAGSVFDEGFTVLGISNGVIAGNVLDDNDQPISGATVAVKNKGGSTVVTYRTDGDGRFTGKLSTGSDAIAQLFGKGTYDVVVDKSGYHENGTSSSGTCTPNEITLNGTTAQVVCRIGQRGTITLLHPVLDASTGRAIPARLTIVGEDPSPNQMGQAGTFYDTDLLRLPFGIVDMKYIAVNGTFGFSRMNTFALEPGIYRFVFSHGSEYGTDERVVQLEAGQTVTIDGVTIPRLIETPGFISADFHLHAIHSPDSSVSEEGRALSAVAEGLDILQSSDHDYLADYTHAVHFLERAGLIPPGSIATSIGNEITPNHMGHIHAFPLEHDAEDVAGGALDWSASPLDEVSTAPDYAMGLNEIIDAARADPGEEVIQLNHIADSPTGAPVAGGWVTSPFYAEGYGVQPLASYADPIERRLPAEGVDGAFPKPYGGSDLLTVNINAVELAIGETFSSTEAFFRSALPTWFNFLNLGILVTATADSDSHTIVKTPIGLPRNFVASSVDPRDGMGSFTSIDLEEYAENINAGRVIISAGPFLTVKAKTSDGTVGGVGDVVTGKNVTLEIRVEAPSWAWFDTIEIYANTEPIPADDETGEPMMGIASDPAQFYNPYHIPRYVYQPTKSFRLIDETLTDWKEENGVIVANVTVPMAFAEDTWLVVMTRGTKETEGYRSLFPLVTNVLADAKEAPEDLNPEDVSSFHADERVTAPAWGLTNPIYVDVDGDGFQAKYIRDGRSPLVSGE
ncbi:MAG: carboxypeptidase regulatory-like domain-containing protein [Deltaproteobacteria bacterium]|nr:carboxypeptidase regulatory-like domain-containing protein [Deltaproteobacteria bacterium]